MGGEARGISRRSFLSGALVLAASVALGGCGKGSSETGASGTDGGVGTVTIGTLATEDILPMWVAREEGLFEAAGISADIALFQSATELIAGVSSGSVDIAMTDPMVSASLFASGTDVVLEWVTLGTTPEQGRFGIMTSASSGITSLPELANVPIGVGSNTILEYVMDNLLAEAGLTDDEIKVEELQKLPVRYQAMVSGEVKAAALPASLLALGEAEGCVLLADDTKGRNLSQSVMIATRTFLDRDRDGEALSALESVWDSAVDLINGDPESYRGTLIANASLSDAVADTYPISTYPHCTRPTNDMVDPVLEWMEKKDYLTAPLSYDEQTGEFSAS